MRSQLRWFCNYDKADSMKIPAEKLLNKPTVANTQPSASAVVDDDDVPF